MKSKVIAGIELGSSKVATLVAQVGREPGSYETSVNIVGAAIAESKGIKKGQIVDIEEAVDATIASVESAERMAGYNLQSAYIATGGAHIHSENSKGVVAVSDQEGEITPEDVNRVIEAASAIAIPASREVVHVIPRGFVVDGENGVKDPVGMSGVRLEVETHIVTASAAYLKNIRKALTEVGIEIEQMVFSGLAASEAVLSPTEKELGTLLIDIGGGTTSIAAFVDGSLAYSGVIPIGAKNVTNDLAIGLRVSLESAEKVKLALSQPPKANEEDTGDRLDLTALGIAEIKDVSKKTLVEGIIRPRLNEIFGMVKLETDKAGISTRVPSGAVITGGGAETVGVLESGKRILTLPVRLGVPKGVGGLVDDIITPSFAIPIGLILYGARKDEPTNLTSSGRKVKLPTKGLIGKLIETVRDLLP